MEQVEFQYTVANLVDLYQFKLYSNLLLRLHDSFHDRFIIAVSRGFDIPTAIDHTIRAAKLPDINYLRYLSFMWIKITQEKLS